MSNPAKLHDTLQKIPIAVVGLAGIFPQSENLQAYWNNIVAEVDCITDVPPSRWRIEDYYDPDPTVPDKTYCKRGGFIPDIEFNPMEYGLPPNILEVTDASQLLSLVVAKQAIADAGYADKSFDRKRAGVILGVGGGQKLITPLTSRLQYPVWERVLESSGVKEEDRAHIIEKMKKAYIHWEENSFPGMLGNVIAGRIANRLDFGGTNCVVDAACAASLASVKMAVSELTEYRNDLMITGGVDTDNSIFMYMSFSKTPAFSKNQIIRPFDANSDGMLIGEGVGMLVLKRLEDAERDNDRIYAVIRGIGSSSDGRYKSIYAPRASGQSLAVDRAYQEAGFSYATVGLVEAHGTGTGAGDPTEFEGLKEVFSHNNPRKQHIALGSVKSQIGHAKAAAGAASLIKTSLALHHKILPPTLNVTEPNPKLDIKNSPFYINAHTRPWINDADGTPRRAGVSAFGFGGTNFHFVLEEHVREHQGAYRVHNTPETLFLSAATPSQLLAECEAKATQLQNDPSAYATWVSQTKTAQIPAQFARVGFVAESVEEAITFLQITSKLLKGNLTKEAWQHPKGIHYRQTGLNTNGKVVALFPGQGSQYLEMGKSLAHNFPPVREAFNQIDKRFKANQEVPLSERVFPIPTFNKDDQKEQEIALRQTEHAQPAIGTISYGLYKLLAQTGFRPDFTAGHSFGELTALWASGVLNDEAYFSLMKARGDAMSAKRSSSADSGTMLAVKGENVSQLQAEVEKLPDVTIANYNSTQQVVLAGSKTAVANAHQALEAQGYKVSPLPVSAAFHTPFVGHAQQPFAQAIDQVPFSAPQIPVYANSTGQPYPNNPRAIQATLKNHILNPVYFHHEIEAMYQAGASVFVEIGPRRVLTSLVEEILGDRPHVAIPLNPSRRKDSDRQLRDAYVQLRVLGMALSPIDPYEAEFTAPAVKKSPVNVQLGGHNYVSPKTEKAYATALTDGHTIVAEKVVEKVVQKVVEKVVVQKETAVSPPAPTKPIVSPPPKLAPVMTKAVPTAVAAPPKPVPSSPPLVTQKVASPVQTDKKNDQQKNGQQKVSKTMSQEERKQNPMIEKSLELLHQHQAETARVHEVYLKGQENYIKTVSQLVQQFQTVSPTIARTQPPASVQPSAPPVITPPPAPEAKKPVNGFKKEEVPTLKPTIAPPKPATAVPSIAPITPPAPVAQAPVIATPAIAPPAPVSDSASNNFAELESAMLEVVSEKTGFPVEMLEMEMDMESDLGIDSIKRVQILGAMQERHPDLPEVNPNELAELRTLQQIVDHLSASGGAVLSAVAETKVASAPVQSVPAVVPATETASNNFAELESAMLEVVSEKTGFPVEMLEMEMDMESDLGIDSIKRVQILGAMQERHPDLPEVNPNELAELRTLQQIVNHLSANGSSAPAPAQTPTVATPPAPASGSSGNNFAELESAMLEVVSEKTGFPVEMLEMEMDMESDLGIDSIKRVQILGAMQERHPDLPEVNPNELAELRTLQQIVDHLGKADPATAGAGKTVVINGVPAPSNHAITRNVAKLQTLPLPDFEAFSLPTTHTCLITDDGTPLTAQVATMLSERGWQVAVLRLPYVGGTHALPAQIKQVTMADTSEAALQQALATVGTIGAFVGLTPHLDGQAETARAVVKQIFFLSKHLQAPLTQAANQTRASFLTVSRLDGALGMDGSTPFEPIVGGLFGLTKTVNLEWTNVYCRAVDVHPELPTEQIAQYVLAELHDPNRLIAEVGYGHHGRVTLVTEETPLTPYTPNASITKESVFVVSGGAKGVTADCVIYLAKQYQCKFVLLGRSAIDDVDTSGLTGDLTDSASLKRQIMQQMIANGQKPSPMAVNKLAKKIQSKLTIEATLNQVRQAGSVVEYLSVDVTDAEALRVALTAVRQRLGEITGLIHGAGVLSDKLIEQKTDADFEMVYGTKVDGLQALFSAIHPSQLQHLVLFSSAAGFYGNVGQADYAVANDILNKTAQSIKLRYPHCHVVAIDWGPWDGGMVTPELKQLFAERGVAVIPVEVGTWLLASEVSEAATARSITQIVVGSELVLPSEALDSTLKTHRVHRWMSLEANPFLNHHVIGQHAVLPTVCAIAWMANLCEQLYPGYTLFSCDKYQVLKGIVFEGAPSDLQEYMVDLEEVEKGDGKIVFKVLVSSQTAVGKPRYHYRSTITLLATLPEAPVYTDFDLSETQVIPKETLYKNGTLFHDAYFQGVEKVLNVSPQKLTMKANLAPIPVSEQGQFVVQSFNPYIADGQFQSMVIWARETHDAGSLPLQTEHGEQYRPIPFGETTYVTMEVLESSSSKLLANIITHDADGLVYARVMGAEVTISQQLNHLFTPAGS